MMNEGDVWNMYVGFWEIMMLGILIRTMIKIMVMMMKVMMMVYEIFMQTYGK